MAMRQKKKKKLNLGIQRNIFQQEARKLYTIQPLIRRFQLFYLL